MTAVNSSSSMAAVTNQINGLARDMQNSQEIQIFKDDTGTRRVLLGRGLNGFYGLKVSEPGKDVYDAADGDLIFNSNQNILKIIATGSGTITAPAAGNSTFVDIPHTAGERVAFLAYGTPPDTSQFWGAGYAHQFPVQYLGLSGGYYVVDSFMDAQITSSDLRIFVTRSASSSVNAEGEWSYRYYILQETAQ